MKRSLPGEVFLGMLIVALLSVGVTGLIARREVDSAFRTYLTNLPTRGMGMGAGRHLVLTAAEQTFMDALNRGILIGAVGAFVLAGIAAVVLAYYLTRPLERLTLAANALAAGDLDHRVDVRGPVEVERLGTAFNDMAGSLGEAEDLRRRMVADVAHELRNPIAALRAQAEGIAEGVLTPDAARLTSIAEDTRYLSRLVEDLQELSAADAGQLRYEMGPLDLIDVARREVASAIERAPDGVAVSVRADAGDEDLGAKLLVEGDEGRLRQVVRNLLDNALAHTDAGSVTVVAERAEPGVATMTSGGASASRVRLEVRDTGEGIPDSDLPYIFERFYRADAARARSTGGSGIGLSIARRIVEDHGGEMYARHADGGGAVVGFLLPPLPER